MNKKKVLIISVSNQDNDPRVIRQINFLRENYDIYCCGISNSIIPKEKFFSINTDYNSLFTKINIGSFKLLKLYDRAENYILKKKLKVELHGDVPEFDIIIANDMDSVPIAYKMFKSKKIVADFHEYAPLEFEDKLYWKYIHKGHVTHQCKKYFPQLNDITTVCNGIAFEYKKNFSKLPEVITNAADYCEITPSAVNDKIKIIHHGAAISSRKIELMIEAVKNLDERFTFDLMLMPNEPAYYNMLKKMTEDCININIIEPVNFNKIIPFCNSYDIGLFILPPANFNYEFALPNKFFEFVQSRLAIVTGPSVEMENYVKKYELGISTKSFEPNEIATEINNLSTSQIETYKNNSHRYAKELSSEKNKELLNNLVNNLISN